MFSFFRRKRRRSTKAEELARSDEAILGFALPPALSCLSFLGREILRTIPAPGVFTRQRAEACPNAPLDTLRQCAQELNWEPVLCEGGLLPDAYSGPLMLESRSGGWFVLLWSESLHAPAVPVWDPESRGFREFSSSQLHGALSGRMVAFRKLARLDAASHSGLTCLALVCRHHGVETDERRLAHEYALDAGEPSFELAQDMADGCGFRCKAVKLDWDKALSLEEVYPVLARKASGRYFLLAGTAVRENGESLLAVIDPSPDAGDTSERRGLHRFWTREDFEGKNGGKALLMQRRYRLDDENQPFGLRWFIPEFLKLKGLFGQIALAVVIMTLLSLLMPLFFQIVIDKVLPNSSFTTLNVLGVGITLAILFNGALEFLRNYLLLFATKKIDVNTAMKTFSHLMRLPVRFFDAVPSGLLIKHMQQTEKIRGFLSGNLFFTILDLLSLVLFVPFLLLYSVPLTGVVLFFSLLMALVVMMLIKPFQRRLDILYQAEGKRQSRLVESLHGIHTVKSLALEPQEEKAWNDATAFSVQSLFNVGKISLSARTLSQILEMLMNVAVIWMGAHLVFDNVISVGALIAFQMLSGRVSGPLVRLIGLVHEYQQTALSVKMLGAVMNTPREHPGGGVRQPVRGGISFEHVRFRYADDQPDILHDFTFDVRPGETIGVVGRSGSGKSTLMRLVQAMYHPQGGVVKIDGIDIRELDKAHLRRNIGVVLQENYFFQGTIRDNIRLTRRDASSEEVIQAAMQAGAHEFVSRMPKGYDTMLEENAANLSGGQKQRLAIARALLMDPAILILDEATSALDPESEQIVKQNLGAIAQGRTVLIVAHRLSMVRRADRILVLDKGHIADLAPHDVLVHREGLYREFWQQQMGD
ncbi:MAG: peptidase domain-containing ABC transporter [Mailhella sp.]|nr:peptidase domain-containing ABC transporter [Mailhella sp.]MBQ4616281.1 peptidase domain-containing ABC transporter [Mailhella sp.]